MKQITECYNLLINIKIYNLLSYIYIYIKEKITLSMCNSNMEESHNIIKYGNTIDVSKELKSYMLKMMSEYKKFFEKKLIRVESLENNIALIGDLTLDEKTNSNEDIFLKIQKKFCIFDLFNLSLLFPIKILNKNGRVLIQIISEDINKTDVEIIKGILKNIDQNKSSQLNFFNKEPIISELLDEIIRQITVMCQKRGFALVLINNELQKNINHYKNLIKIIEQNNELHGSEFKQQMEQHNELMEHLSKEENELKEKLEELQYELEILKNENKKKLQENKNHKEIQYDVLKHNESLLEKIKELYDKKGEI